MPSIFHYRLNPLPADCAIQSDQMDGRTRLASSGFCAGVEREREGQRNIITCMLHFLRLTMICRLGNFRRLRSFFAFLAFCTPPARPLGRQPGRMGTETRRCKRLLDLPTLLMNQTGFFCAENQILYLD